MILNLAVGRSREMYWTDSKLQNNGTTVVICRGTGPLKRGWIL